MTRSAFLSLGAALLPTVLLADSASAQATISPKIQKILDSCAAAYRSASALSMVMKTKQGAHSASVNLLITRAGKMAATVTTGHKAFRVVADGTNIYADSSEDTGHFVKQPGKTLATAIAALAQSEGAGVGLLPLLLTEPAAQKRIIPGTASSVTLGAAVTMDEVACDVILATLSGEQNLIFKFTIGKADHLVRQIVITDPKTKAVVITETYTQVNAKPRVVASAFVYKPAPGAVVMAPEAAPREPERFDPRLVVGAAPFALVGSDLSGNAVSYDDYKGKVLLVDFWATWCGPCVAELPNVIAAYTKYHDQGFEVLGISLDQDNAKDKLEAFIKEHSMPWRQVYDGKFWEAANAVNYKVQSIPFTLLIGKDGKIAAVGARGPALAPAIEAALKG